MATAPINPITNQPYSAYYKPGQDSGAITLEWRGRILRATVRSFTRPSGPRHTIEANQLTGHVRCTCDAYGYARERRGGSYATLTDERSGWCKHIAAWWEQLAAEITEHGGVIASETEAASLSYGWRRRLAEYPLGSSHPDVAVIDRQMYVIGREAIERPPFAARFWRENRGCGGQRFVIRFLDGRTVETTNLQVSGDVPDRLRDIFCDNAVFEGRPPAYHRCQLTEEVNR